MIENNRFKFESGNEMNGFWIAKTLNDHEKSICYRIVKGGGNLGWDEKSLNAAHIKRSDINHLIGEGLVKTASLLDISKEFIRKDNNHENFIDLEETYGFSMVPKEEKRFFWDFVRANQIIEDKENPEYQKTHYKIIDELSSFLDITL
jgi:hypothetical protein